MKIFKVPEGYRPSRFLWLKFCYCLESDIPVEYSTLSLDIGLKHYIIEHKNTIIGYLSFKVLVQTNTLYLFESYLIPSKRYYLDRVIAKITRIVKKGKYNGIVIVPSHKTIQLYKKHNIAKEL